MIHIREFDGDPSRTQHAPEGDGAAALGLSAAFAEEAGPQCLAHYVVVRSPPPATGSTDGASSSPSLQELSSSHSIPKRTMRQALRHCFVVPFIDLFLPEGYPHSVGEGYLAYQIYDSLQGICSYLRGVVASSAVLTAAGVGSAEATAMSAAVSWALRDGAGMIGGLLFSYVASAQFDSHVKEFRLFADVINDVGLTLDMLAPYAGRGRILYITSLAAICKTMCGMAAGATKGSITHHFAIHGNMADLNAKESTQETLVSLLGMIFGVGLARYLHALEKQDDKSGQSISWLIFMILTIVHVWQNYLGVKILKLRTLNRERAEVVLGSLINECVDRCEDSVNNDTRVELLDVEPMLKTILTPDISESLWSSSCKLFFSGGLHLRARVGDAFQGMEQVEISEIMEAFKDERYFITLKSGRAREIISVVLCAGSTEEDELKAFVHALVLLALCKRNSCSLNEDVCHQRYTSTANTCVKQLFRTAGPKSVGSSLSLKWLKERGWETNRLYLGFGRYRAQISDEWKKEE